MAKETKSLCDATMKQVAVRMYPEQHESAMKEAARRKMSFGELVRLAVVREVLRGWKSAGLK